MPPTSCRIRPSSPEGSCRSRNTGVGLLRPKPVSLSEKGAKIGEALRAVDPAARASV